MKYVRSAAYNAPTPFHHWHRIKDVATDGSCLIEAVTMCGLLYGPNIEKSDTAPYGDRCCSDACAMGLVGDPDNYVSTKIAG